MDKSLTKMTKRVNRGYLEGAKEFAEMSKLYADVEGRASCPCTKCLNANGQPTDIIFHHIVQFSFDQSYDVWVNNCEILPDFEDFEEHYEVDSGGEEDNDYIEDLLHDIFLG